MQSDQLVQHFPPDGRGGVPREDLVQGKNPPIAFVIGNKDGLTELELLK